MVWFSSPVNVGCNNANSHLTRNKFRCHLDGYGKTLPWLPRQPCEFSPWSSRPYHEAWSPWRKRGISHSAKTSTPYTSPGPWPCGHAPARWARQVWEDWMTIPPRSRSHLSPLPKPLPKDPASRRLLVELIEGTWCCEPHKTRHTTWMLDQECWDMEWSKGYPCLEYRTFCHRCQSLYWF